VSLTSHKAGTRFGTVQSSAKKLTPETWAIYMFVAGFPSVQVVAEGLGIIDNETGGSFSADPGGDGAHFGGWQEDSSFGSVADRLDPEKATKAAYKRWKEDGESFYPAWGRWEKEQSGQDGAKNWARFKQVAETAAVKVATVGPSGGGDYKGSLVEEGVNLVKGPVESAEDFITEAFHFLTNFRSLGQLAAEATAWFLKLIAKAIWDYLIAPALHWTERAVSFYWVNFFGEGVEQGSGFGYQLRNNAGTITILFWSLGYAILWSDGQGSQLVSPQDSMLGQGVRGVEGLIARRNLVKPKDIKKSTPTKPKPKVSEVTIQPQGTFAVSRKRPVSVSSQGRKETEHGSSRRRLAPSPIQRPTKKLKIARGYSRKAQTQRPSSKPAKPGKPGMGTRPVRGGRTKDFASRR
jgi:hypothetical protein